MDRIQLMKENEASFFAMCLLIPEKLLREHLVKTGHGGVSFEEIERLAKLFKVDESLMTLRLVHLKEI